MHNLGLVQVYTGNGKGKTTASLGLALRACGHGFKVCMIQFMKESRDYGEVPAADFLHGFTLYQVGRNDFVNLEQPETLDIELARNGWNLARQIIESKEYEIVILDEINVAMACGLIDSVEIIGFLQKRPPGVEVILTGRYAPQALIDFADLVTEMKDIKHPYSSGLLARKGIEH